jgi:hypothetical protein
MEPNEGMPHLDEQGQFILQHVLAQLQVAWEQFVAQNQPTGQAPNTPQTEVPQETEEVESSPYTNSSSSKVTLPRLPKPDNYDGRNRDPTFINAWLYHMEEYTNNTIFLRYQKMATITDQEPPRKELVAKAPLKPLKPPEKPPELETGHPDAPVDKVWQSQTSSAQSNTAQTKIKTNNQNKTNHLSTQPPPNNQAQAFLNKLLALKEAQPEDPMAPDELDFLGASREATAYPSRQSKQTISNRTGQSQPTIAPGAPTKANPTKLSDFTELEEELHESKDTPTTNLDAIHQDSIAEVLTGLKYITLTLTKETFEETRTEMLNVINHVITLAKAIPSTISQQSANTTQSQIISKKLTPSTPTTNAPPTYAAMAAKQQQREVVRKQRTKTEVNLALPISTDPDALANQIQRKELPEEALCQMLEEHIKTNLKVKHSGSQQTVKLLGAKRISKGILKLICSSPEEANIIRNDINWNTTLGAHITKPNYGVVLHGVSKEEVDPRNSNFSMSQAISTFNSQNPGANVVRITTLMRKPKNPNAPTHSIILFTEDPKEADHLILRGARIANRVHAAQRYTPQFQITRCFNCQGYGHKAQVCTRPYRCGNCSSSNHKTAECQVKEGEFKCPSCQGNHKAWDDICPRKKDEISKLEYLRNSTPPTFEDST